MRQCTQLANPDSSLTANLLNSSLGVDSCLGCARMCGCNWDGQLGLGHKSNRLLPEMISVFSSADQPHMSQSGRPARMDDCAEYVQASGSERCGEVEDDWDELRHGDSGVDSRHARRQVPEICAIAAGSADVLSGSNRLSSTGFVVAVDREGWVWSWGEGRFGQLGHGDTDERIFPTRIERLGGVKMQQAAAGGRHSVLVSQAGVVWTSGHPFAQSSGCA